jgi:hypothetical protein
MKEGIKYHIDEKYASLEKEFLLNMGTKSEAVLEPIIERKVVNDI